jgi:hypothetical protein
MKVSDFFDVIGGILTIALVATILNKANTAPDLKAAGTAFTGALHEAKA